MCLTWVSFLLDKTPNLITYLDCHKTGLPLNSDTFKCRFKKTSPPLMDRLELTQWRQWRTV